MNNVLLLLLRTVSLRGAEFQIVTYQIRYKNKTAL